LDLYAYSFDGSLGFQPSFVVGRWFQDYPVVQAVGRFTYYSLPLAMALVYAAHLRLRKTAPLFIFEIFMAAGLLGYFLYLTFPAAGPVYLVGSAFPGFPLSLSDLRALPLRTIPISVAIPRNAMPSLHLTWALLIWFNSKPLSRLASALAFTLVLTTVFDTIGMGEHYSSISQWPSRSRSPYRHSVLAPSSFDRRFVLPPLMGGATLTLLWLIMLHYGIRIFLLTPLIPWACVISSTLWSWSGCNKYCLRSRVNHEVQLGWPKR
jgi:hypothetical protein